MDTTNSITFISDVCGALKTLKRTGWVKHQVPYPESISDHMHRCTMCVFLLQNEIASTTSALANDSTTTNDSVYDPHKLNMNKLFRMAVTHDLCESIAGDITPYCRTISMKEEKEREAMKKIGSIVGDPLGEELFHLWKEYEEQITIEAIYCKDIDKFEMIVQAYEYEKQHLRARNESHSNDDNNTGNDNNEISNKRKRHEQQQQPDDKTTNEDPDHRIDVFTEPMRGFFVSTNSVMKTPFFRRLDSELREKRKCMLQQKGWNTTKEEDQNYE